MHPERFCKRSGRTCIRSVFVDLPCIAIFCHLSGREYHAANAEHMQEEVLFTINWRSDVTTAHVIRYNGVLWNITRVDTFEGYKGAISLYCRTKVENLRQSY